DIVHDKHWWTEDARHEAHVDDHLLGEGNWLVTRRVDGHVAKIMRVESSSGLQAHILVCNKAAQGLGDAWKNHCLRGVFEVGERWSNSWGQGQTMDKPDSEMQLPKDTLPTHLRPFTLKQCLRRGIHKRRAPIKEPEFELNHHKVNRFLRSSTSLKSVQ